MPPPIAGNIGIHEQIMMFFNDVEDTVHKRKEPSEFAKDFCKKYQLHNRDCFQFHMKTFHEAEEEYETSQLGWLQLSPETIRSWKKDRERYPDYYYILDVLKYAWVATAIGYAFFTYGAYLEPNEQHVVHALAYKFKSTLAWSTLYSMTFAISGKKIFDYASRASEWVFDTAIPAIKDWWWESKYYIRQIKEHAHTECYKALMEQYKGNLQFVGEFGENGYRYPIECEQHKAFINQRDKLEQQ